MVDTASSSEQLLHSHDNSKVNLAEDMLSKLGKQDYLEVGDDSRLKADVIMISDKSRDREILFSGECRAPEIIVILPTGTTSVTSHGTGRTAESASSENFQRLHRALSAAAHSRATIVVATNSVPSTLDATCDKEVDPPLGPRNALGYLIAKHPKTMSNVSTVLITVGSIALLPGMTAMAAGTIFAHPAVTVAGAIAVAVGKWLKAAVQSATASGVVQAQPSNQAVV